ncbi:hypothetical protein CGLAU_06075 [Corynebacterium glaucum]|uniref:5-bromo-4-chloroindolyl phosphate hydrolysis protein n=1 Tax=Corynebacterium glaucum TaxID=187491 RepID=A0A1Q2HWH7_9CORY|nr:hypothetical protein [Corynebacterium glaucum]AQQ15182.1 hypothetical protein CGLAU_06075 [Corynebacterium glaucum]WJZ07679.1 hypothetical protein CGLAUT_05930 [Corynebacterium glaucum]
MVSSSSSGTPGGFQSFLVSRRNQVGLLLAILVVTLHIALGLGFLWPVAAAAAYGAGVALTPPAKPKELPPPPITPTPIVLEDAMRETSGRLFKAGPPSAVVNQVKELEANIRFVLKEWDHLQPTPEHRQTMWNVVKVYYPEVISTYLDVPQFRDEAAVSVVVDSLTTLTNAVARIKKGILDDNLRAMDSQAQFLRGEFGALPGLDDDLSGSAGYDKQP